MIHINQKEKALVDSETGQLLRPTCFMDLIAYHSYLIGKKKFAAAQGVLQDVFKGEMVISKMIANVRKHGLK